MQNNDKLDLQSIDFVSHNIEKIAQLFPHCVTESADGKKIDFDLLKQELSADIVEGNKERYRLEWPGKREAIVTANIPTTKTLRPVREDSVDFDTTENIYIEGDNLEVLKLLQESYLGKIKMIYIDPPYNTGKDFVYKDNFAKSGEEELVESGQKDEYNQRLVANPETSGRYHSDWLSMMYPRLKLARNLLTDDGVIFISIDDNEVHNLRKICDEIFGEGNFVADIIWQKKTGSADSNGLSIVTENILCFAKKKDNLVLNQDQNAHDIKRFKFTDEYVNERGPFYYDNLDRGTLGYHISLDYPVQSPDGTLIYPNGRKRQYNDGWRWKWGQDKLDWGLKNGFVEILKTKDNTWKVYYKIYLNVDNEGNTIKRSTPYKNIIQGILNTHASAESKNIFGTAGLFSNPKPALLLNHLLNIGVHSDSIILDFFSGSATTAHAVMQLNAEDASTGSAPGKRKYIMVQVPEATDEKSEAYKAGYKNICEIGKERIRRAAKKIRQNLDSQDKKDSQDLFNDNQGHPNNPTNPGADIDLGFRVYRLDSSNMEDVYYKPQDFSQGALDLFADNVKEDRTAEDLVTQVMLDWGLQLSLPMEKKTIASKEVYAVAGDSLYCCFDTNIDEAFAKEVAKDQPLRIVFRDKGFKDDTAKENVKQLIKQLSPNTEMKVV